MLLVAIAFGLLLTLEVLGFVLLHLKISALATELRRARTVDAHALADRLDAIATKEQGMRVDLATLARELRAQRQTVDALAFELEGPPSLRHPTPLSRF